MIYIASVDTVETFFTSWPATLPVAMFDRQYVSVVNLYERRPGELQDHLDRVSLEARGPKRRFIDSNVPEDGWKDLRAGPRDDQRRSAATCRWIIVSYETEIKVPFPNADSNGIANVFDRRDASNTPSFTNSLKGNSLI